MRRSITIGKWDIEFTNGSLCKWDHFKIHQHGYHWYNERKSLLKNLIEGLKYGYVLIVFGKLTLVIEDWTNERYVICDVCGSTEIGEVSAGDEGLTVCQDCGSVEQGYKCINKHQYDALDVVLN
jgi:hypothetical protein